MVSATGPLPSMDERLFQAVYQLMGTQALPPEVRAALFRGLATIPGVSFTEDVADADGRRGSLSATPVSGPATTSSSTPSTSTSSAPTA